LAILVRDETSNILVCLTRTSTAIEMVFSYRLTPVDGKSIT